MYPHDFAKGTSEHLSGMEAAESEYESVPQIMPEEMAGGREFLTKHTIIISGNGRVYQLIGMLDADESKALYQQTQLRMQGNIILGEGDLGKVYLVQNNAGVFMAVKKMENPALLINEHIAQDLLGKNGIKVLPVLDTINVGNWHGEPIIYQVMPIANVGSGLDLLNHWNAFNREERGLMLQYLTQVFVSEFAKMYQLRILHRNFKPNKFLFDLSSGMLQAYLADCGAVAMFNKENKMEFKVSDRITGSYFPPEFLHAHRLEITGLDNHFDIYHANEAWRLGLTLLHFVSRALADKYINLASELKSEKSYPAKLQRYAMLHKELESVLESEHVPADISAVISGLLKPDWQDRLTLQAATTTLRDEKIDQKAITPLFEKMIALRAETDLVEEKTVVLEPDRETFFSKVRNVMGLFRHPQPPSAKEKTVVSATHADVENKTKLTK